MVTIKPIRVGLSLAAAQRIEKQIIKRLRPQLVNVHEGGSSGYAGLPPDAKARHSEAGEARYKDPKQKQKALEALQLAYAATAKKMKEKSMFLIPRPLPGTLLKTIRVTDEIAGCSFEIKVRQGRRLNQIVAETFGRQSGAHGCAWLTAHLRQKLVTRWMH